jgi:hypothetical protein
MASISKELYTVPSASGEAHSRDDSIGLSAGPYAYLSMSAYLIPNDVIDHGILLGGDTTLNQATITTLPKTTNHH